MNLIPNKTIKPEYSLLGIGAVLLREISDRDTVTSLWEKVRQSEKINTYEKFLSALVLLYALGVIDLRDGVLVKSEIS